MAWTINYIDSAKKQLGKLDKQAAKRIADFMDERIAILDDPRTIGKSLVGAVFGELWCYRIGDYRVIANIEDEAIEILVIRIGHRKDVYNKF